MLKFGKIQEVDITKGRVKVRFEEDDLVSDWIPILISQTKDNRFYYYPSVREHVACHMDENCENGVVLGSVYSERDSVPSDLQAWMAGYKNGSVTIRVSDDVLIINVGESEFRFDTDQINLTTSVTVNIVASSVNIDGDVEVSGSITADGEITTNLNSGVNLSTHVHVGVQPGPGVTGTPQPGS